jgi:hypothetical protein
MDDSAWIIQHFCGKGHNVHDSMQKEIRIRLVMSHQGQNKENYIIFNDFHEVLEDSMLIQHGEMVTIILHKFVAMTEASKHV